MIDLDNLEDSISKIYRKYYLDVYRFLVCFSGNQDDAEDITQEVFIRVLNNLCAFNNENNLKTWIFSIAKHVAVDHYRKKRFSSIFNEGFFKQIESPNKSPNDLVEQNELKMYIHEAISKLKPKYRAVVILRGINELSVKETSEVLNCSESKVKVDYHRAIKDLKKKLKLNVEEVIRHAK
ncbi:RNA polymerase sigma-70 factor (ECF subfamily) [Bacillus tianshenii]|uniref:RNA polymerase sigma factor n=1 Tax=Sutcliffiella tianshenii TaxID=1463404 RepID=A0ABS2NYC5_9BACI|nr:sigma-70 family RNA polymerase sigma factor [Bacillus tianshenii]MBM7619681.1 RNA polymerase sigma-70 factor (ECF subfamily) [Bacillus tianshenii]